MAFGIKPVASRRQAKKTTQLQLATRPDNIVLTGMLSTDFFFQASRKEASGPVKSKQLMSSVKSPQ
eukprot:CAMPEP_0197643568 /NCGR_PEP_ID=MMETSP1338-20131121/16839_1 /TAXON_ID=43686 ORGANISM="Pelagodinium beii, Strain RCC1491" /NCGR_SAMPLE_ID=MMETSP1338 /ASSEMBLY_ACC=CAM_ASM_000754 /LENGTH=65 /DNA_ID=CAMNT_0043216833 /DNA_START=121 /DNA_END=321 /DNA_ORIENTATION=-